MAAQADPWTMTARWVFPVTSPPIENGRITISADRILAVESANGRHADIELGDVALLPGLVNAHTHLDLSGLRSRCTPTKGAPFTDWLRQVIRHRRAQTPEQIAVDVRTGLAESIASGTTLIGDIAGQGASWPALANAPIRSVVFYEVLGLPASQIKESARTAANWLDEHREMPHCRPALSPHAPYSVNWRLFEKIVKMAFDRGVALATHLAESQEELELLYDRRGPFVEFLQELGVWDERALALGPWEIISSCGSAPKSLLVHGNYLAHLPPIPRSASLVFCPRTHAAFGHAPHPFTEWLAQGLNVALGTDSLASNPDLDVLAEARFLRRQHPLIPGKTLLRMATLNGAIALGWEDETGSLDSGKSADLVVVPLANNDRRDPHDLIFASAERVRAVMCRGRWVYGDPSSV